MELEEAIDNLTMLKYFIKTEGDENWEDCCNSIETVLKELDVLKFKYQARKDRTDTIITKQEKMIEILLDLYWNKEQVRLIIEYGIVSKEQLRKEIERKVEEDSKCMK